MLTLEKFEEASEKVKEVTLETKLIYSEYLSNQTGNKVYLKPENLQFTGAYKVRGAYYKISTLSEEERKRGLITASAGNHAQGVAYAAKCYGCKATIVMPTTTPLIKVNRTKGYGAEVVLYGDVYDEACQKAYELAEEHGYTFIHPFDDLAVATGQGTIAMEIFKELPLVEYILVPIGGGGLATGVSTLAKLLNPKIKVIGVEPAGANCMQASFAAGKVTTLPSVSTIADGTAVKTPGSKIFPYIQKNLDDIITVEDDELVASFLDMVENHKMVVENSGLLTVAALKHLDVTDKRVVSILSGGNMDVITMSSVVQNGLILRDRIFTVSVLLPDKPGELSKVSATIAKEQGAKTWDELLKEYDEIVHIPMSSGLSGSCQTAIMLAQEEEYEGKVYVVNNQRISVTQRQSVIDAKGMAEAGYDAAAIQKRLEETKFDSTIYITLDTLHYLKKGGRITPAAAALGTILRLKPVLQIQGEKLDAYSKARTYKIAKNTMLDAIAKDIEERFDGKSSPEDIYIAIAHTDNLAAAEEFRDEVKAIYPEHDIYIDHLSLSVACHIGPGALAITATKVLKY